MANTMETENMQGSKRRRNPANINAKTLPDEVIEEILSRLPSKSLLRFRSVHKQWLSLISHPNFVQSNLKHVLSDHHQKLMLSSPGIADSFFQLYSIHYESIDNAVKFKLPFDLPVLAQTMSRFLVFCFFGSCNGLLCTGIQLGEEIGGIQVIISNPLLKIHKKVTDFNCFRSLSYNNLVGFGYDSVADNYKLVSVDLHCGLVNVYSLKNNSSRSFPLQPPPINCHVSRRPGMFFNGSLYWLADDDKQSAKPPTLIWFDLDDERIGMVEVPVDQDRSLKWGSELTVVRGCLCIFTLDSKSLYLKSLIMKVEKSNVISWSVGANLEQPCGLQERPICITTDGGILMRVKDNFGEKDKREERLRGVLKEHGLLDDERPSGRTKYKLIINNPHKGIIKNIPLHGSNNIWYDRITYSETLVSPI